MKRFYIAFGYECTNKCFNCIISDDTYAKLPRMSYNDFVELMDRYSIGNDDIIEITGGEPTFDGKLFYDVLKYARQELGFRRERINVLTNGMSFASLEFTTKTAPLFGHVVSTFYSHHPDIHDKITQTPGSFVLKKEGLLNLKRHQVVLHIKTLIARHNVNELSDFITFVNHYFPDSYILFAWVDYRGQAWKNRHLLLVELEEAAPYIEESIETARKLGVKLSILFPLCLLDPCHWDGLIPRDLTEELEKAVFIDPLNPSLIREQPGEELIFLEKPDECNNCALKNRCVWEWKSYQKLRQLSMLKPIEI